MREDYTSPAPSCCVRVGEFLARVAPLEKKGDIMDEIPMDSHYTMLLRSTINKIRMVLSNAEDTLDELSARQNRKAKAEFVEYLKTGKRGGDIMAAKKVSKAAPKLPKGKIGKAVKKK